MDFSVIIIGALLAAVVIAAEEIYRQINRAHKQYEKAKNVVEDIILSFGRELKREAAKIDSVDLKASGNAGKIQTTSRRLDTLESHLPPIESRLAEISDGNSNILAKFTEIDAKVRGLKESNELASTKIAGLEEQLQKLLSTPEVRSEMVIPIRRDKALGPLTQTEIEVVEMLTNEGPKTAPEIKERVRLSREHTARLMKKLYEGGYLERETGKTPFRYTVKKEMENLLKKTESARE